MENNQQPLLSDLLNQIQSGLSLWSETAPKQALIKSLMSLCDPDSEHFVPVAKRVAVFDQDGTLWPEQPHYVHVFAILAQMSKQMQQNPALVTKQPYRAIYEKDFSYFQSISADKLTALVMGKPFAGLTDEDLMAQWLTWSHVWRHPKFDLEIGALIYQPMLCLMKLLKQLNFTLVISTADDEAFVSAMWQKYAEQWQVVPDRVIGTQFVLDESHRRTSELSRFNYDQGKAVSYLETGLPKPVLAFGNTDRDVPLLHLVEPVLSTGQRWMIDHDDSMREFSYDHELQATKTQMKQNQDDDIILISMLKDWTVIF